jgi:hypothetical protein
MCSVRPYEIPYGALLPKSLCNLAVPICLSASHAGYGTLRMEPVMMNLGLVCGLAAAQAREAGTGFDEIDVEVLQRELIERRQVIRAPDR